MLALSGPIYGPLSKGAYPSREDVKRAKGNECIWYKSNTNTSMMSAIPHHPITRDSPAHNLLHCLCKCHVGTLHPHPT
jgi:hypothetical protein